ncbi:MAG: hypothetical protein ABIP51_12585 [Bacteroidia bacterium]
MKSLIVFYSVCVLLFYSLMSYIGHRNKKYAAPESSGLLEDVTVPSTDYKISKAKLLAQNFDNAIVYTKMEEPRMASKEIYKAITSFAIHSNSSPESYAQKTMNSILKDLSICYIDLERKQQVPQNMNNVFERSELFIAYGFIHKSQNELKHGKIMDALENIYKAQECLALSAKYAEEKDLNLHLRLLKNTKELVEEITDEESM